jgi:hypothetical protein
LELRFTAQHPRFSVYEVEDTFGGLGFMRRRTHVEVYYFLCTQPLVVEAVLSLSLSLSLSLYIHTNIPRCTCNSRNCRWIFFIFLFLFLIYLALGDSGPFACHNSANSAPSTTLKPQPINGILYDTNCEISAPVQPST